MTTTGSLLGLIEVATDLAAGLSDAERFRRLLAAAHRLIPFDAAAILALEGRTLRPIAAIGLDDQVLGRRFDVSEQPRFRAILESPATVVFPADSTLPDPYDGLIHETGPHLDVHSCMGSRLDVRGRPWGLLTFDALEPGVFDAIDPVITRAFSALAAASAATASYIQDLEDRYENSAALLHDMAGGPSSDPDLIGDSAPMQRLRDEIDVVARSGFTVLISGETGTGKELVARRVFRQSDRAHSAFVQLNCAALPETLAESELFGHRRGAFTGATSDRRGKFALADGGTLFLDEVGELSLPLQAKLLRVLQSGEIQRVGEDATTTVDVRIIAATNRDLAAEAAAGRFRADLYQRLAVYPLSVPPLRERTGDIAKLSGYFMERLARELGKPQMRLSASALQRLQAYDWPGNVRELQHVLSRAALRVPANKQIRSVRIDALHIDLGDQRPTPVASDAGAIPQGNLADATADFQRGLIRRSLDRHDGNRSATAIELGVDRSNLHRLMKRLDML